MPSTTQDIARSRAFRQRGPHPRGRMLLALALLGALSLATAALTASALASAPPASTSASTRVVLVMSTPGRCAHTGLRPAAGNLPKVEAATLCLINALRRAHHLHTLRFNADLHAVAAGQASEMVLGDYFGDDNRAGQTPLQRIVASSYPQHAARVSTAQNIGWGTGPDATPAAMVRAWTRSPPHLRIILTAGYRDIGIGVAPAVPANITGSALGATYTVEFGVRRTAKSSAPASGTAGHAAGTGTGLTGGTAG